MFFIVRIYNVTQINGLSPRKNRFTLHEKSVDLAHTVHIYLAHIFYQVGGELKDNQMQIELKLI